jgi:hypothetical protein
VATENDFNIGLRQLLALFDTMRKELTIVLDEFQQVLEYPESRIENLLRPIVQENPQITFIFSGSDKHMMETMFSNPTRPFFQSVELMYLGPIVTENYLEFIKNHFNAAGFNISEATINQLLNWCRHHTYYVQHFCNRLFAKSFHIINEETTSVSKPLSGAFIKKHDLKSASSVKTSLVALAGKEMLIRSNDTWQVYDVFFARWLEHTWKRLNL